MAETYDVIINGGGPVGAGLAIDLGQRGVRVALVERHAHPQRVPKGQNLTQRTTEHFLFWNCLNELRAAHPVPKGAGIGGMTSYGTLLSGHHYDWLNRANVAPYYYTQNARLPQYETEDVLRARVAQLEKVDTFYGWAGVALDQDAEGVSLTIAEHKGDGRRSLRGAYAVGCDGSHSFVREAAGITQTLSDHDRLMALLVFRSPELHTLLECYPGKAFYNVLRPDMHGYWLFFGRVDHGVSWFFHAPVPLGTTPEDFDFRTMLHKAVGQPFALEFDHIGLWHLRVAIADSYRAGRVFIAGDAAHSHPPYGGYGINTGLEDARNLGWKLAATLQGWGGAALLDSYDAERRPVFASTARDFIERFIREDREFLESHAPGDADFAERWQGRNLDAAEVHAFEPHYEGSPLIGGAGQPGARGSHVFTARSGHHLPPQDLTDGRNVYEALGSGFTLLTHDRTAAQAAMAGSGMPVDLVATLSDAARAAYGADLILVRPDHYVAWVGAGGQAPDWRRVTGG